MIDDGTRQPDPLLLAARQFARVSRGIGIEMNHPQRLGHAPLLLGHRDAPHPQRKRHVAGDRQMRQQREALEHHAHIAPMRGQAVMSAPSSRTRPPSGASVPAITRSNVVLPQPLGPSSERNIPRGTAQADVGQRRQPAPVLADMLEFQPRRTHAPLSPPRRFSGLTIRNMPSRNSSDGISRMVLIAAATDR